MTIYTPNIVITKSYDFMNKFMAGDYLSNINTSDLDDTLVFLGKQNRFVYSLDYSFNFGQSDGNIVIKVVDVDGSFENEFLNETFYEKLMATNMEKYLKFSKTASEFQEYFTSILDSRLKLYITYGVGDDLVNWADPITCTLVGADVDVANTGLRNYTYKFAPLPNAFFSPTPAKDDADPNVNNLFDFGSNAVSIEHSIQTIDYKNVNQNVKNLLKGFMSKVANVPEGNILVLLPELSYNSIADNFKAKTRVGEFGNTTILQSEYQNIFKVIFYEKIPSDTVTLFKGVDFKKAKTSVADFFVENEKKNREAAEKYEKELQKLNKEKLESNVKRASQTINPIVMERKKIDKEIIQLQEALQRDTHPRYKQTNLERSIKLEELTKRRDDLTAKLRAGKTPEEEAAEKARDEQIKNLQGDSKFRKFAASINKGISNLVNNLPANIPKIDRKTPEYHKLTIRSSIQRTGRSSSAPIPDVRQTVTDVFTGLNLLHKGGEGYITETIAFETNLRWLKLFKSFGFIDDEKSPCLVIGDRQLVLDYLYCNQTPINDINKVTPANLLDKNDSLYKILTSQEYKSAIIDIVRRKKTSSSFSEKLYIDELSFENETSRAAMSELEAKAIESDIPIFINNFRNANVLSYSLKNTENYFSVMNSSVRDNRLKYLYSTFDDPTVTKILEKYGITSTSGGPDPIVLSKIYFTNTLYNLSKNVRQVAYEKIPKSDISGLSELMFDTTKDATKWDFTGQQSKKLIGEQFGLFKNIGETNNIDKSIFKGLILTNGPDSVSYLNLALQVYLRDNVKGISGEDLAAVAEFLILLNASNNDNNMGSISFSPGLNLPGNKFILSRITEYVKRFAVEMAIKTLPFFNLSELRTINKPALFFSKRISPLNTPVDQFDFFSGEYRITGFRHVITTSECFSEFMLTKYGASDDLIRK